MTSVSRTRAVIRQAGLGLVLRLGAVAASFVATPIMLRLLGQEQLGVWLVLLSVLQWIAMFDLGISAGARNEIARAVASEDAASVRSAITTGWWYVALTSAALFAAMVIALTATPLQPWLVQKVFGGIDPGAALWIVVACACLSFGMGYIQSVFAALEKASAFSVYSLASNVAFLALLLLMGKIVAHWMTGVALLYLLGVLGSNGWLIVRFWRQYPQYRPMVQAFDAGRRQTIMGFGIRLFAIQMAALVIFTTSRLLASMLLGAGSVVVYDAGFKIFSLVTMIHTLVMSTMWSSFTQAYARREIAWIRRSLSKLVQLMAPLVLGCLLLAWLSPWIIGHWLGPAQVGPGSLYVLFSIATVLGCWSNIFAFFLNGIGDTGLQLFSAIVAGIINIPATYYFTVSAGFGISGLLMGTITSLGVFSILGPLHVARILKRTTTE